MLLHFFRYQIAPISACMLNHLVIRCSQYAGVGFWTISTPVRRIRFNKNTARERDGCQPIALKFSYLKVKSISHTVSEPIEDGFLCSRLCKQVYIVYWADQYGGASLTKTKRGFLIAK